MVKSALGLIEVVGLAAGVEAADAAVKAADVKLLGYELTKGGGMVVIKLCGNVGAVKAAVEAGAAAAKRVSKVYAVQVIPRPHSDLGSLVITKDTIAKDVVPKPAESCVKSEEPAEIEEGEQPEQVEELVLPAEETNEEVPKLDQLVENLKTVQFSSSKKASEICNLCGDPNCSRKKGDPKVTCIHYERNNKEDE
ncbi:BMC domain-containing protein [Dendrosporobacter sp. 1207_IL3150]|uniref:BMC domain-containing protein n=1 Tax=Dendrosporobacter sp. 1207_IL3150 TaxID=3084054 RepID=UPI002FD8ABBC